MESDSVVIQWATVKKTFLTKIRKQLLSIDVKLPAWVFRSLFRKTSTFFPMMTRLGGITVVCIDLPALCRQASQEAFQVALLGVD